MRTKYASVALKATELGRRDRRRRAAGAWLMFGAFALFLQILSAPLHDFGWSSGRVAALAEAAQAFGGEVAVCSSSGDAVPSHPGGNHCDDCPICRFTSESALIAPPAPAQLSGGLDTARRLEPRGSHPSAPPYARFSPAQPRAPPAFA